MWHVTLWNLCWHRKDVTCYRLVSKQLAKGCMLTHSDEKASSTKMEQQKTRQTKKHKNIVKTTIFERAHHKSMDFWRGVFDVILHVLASTKCNFTLELRFNNPPGRMFVNYDSWDAEIQCNRCTSLKDPQRLDESFITSG